MADVSAGRTIDCDLLVIGSGASGLAAAVTAAWLGLDVVVAEKTPVLGGTSAWSGGWLWIPNNPLARAALERDETETVRSYLRAEVGSLWDEALIETFLRQGPRMVAFFRRHTEVDFVNGTAIPDFHGRVEGAAVGNRAVGAAPYDGRELGPAIRLLRPPLDLLAPFGMNIASGADLAHFYNFLRKPASFLHVTRRVLRHFRDLALHGRGMHLVNGNALVARLLRSALDLKVRILTEAPAQGLWFDGGQVKGARLAAADGEVTVRASRGVALAAGGFPHDRERKSRLFLHDPTGQAHHSAAPETNTGDGLRLAETAGGVVREDMAAGGGWAPVSLVPGKPGRTGRFPHLVDRAKPGLIMVAPDGQRFCNEADSYHDVMTALFARTPPGQTPEAWMVCDHGFLRRWGLGRVRPRPFPVRPWVRNGYLKRGRTLVELAGACGLPAGAFAAAVDRYNESAREGEDPEFGRGSTAFNRAMGDPERRPNPNLAPIERSPFYALRIVPGSLSTFAGLRTDAHARVLDRSGSPIAGLYAVGNDMASIAGGSYPAGGFTLGPGMTFGYVAAHHAAGVPLDSNAAAMLGAASSEPALQDS